MFHPFSRWRHFRALAFSSRLLFACCLLPWASGCAHTPAGIAGPPPRELILTLTVAGVISPDDFYYMALDFSGDARGFMRRYHVSYPVVHDGGGTTVGPYGLTGYPETFFLDRKGRLVGRHVAGPVKEGELDHNIRLALRS